MAAPPQAPVDRIGGICRHFTDLTGWPLVFTPAGSQPDEERSCWSARIGTIGTDEDLQGTLHLARPAVSQRAFDDVRSLAELVADVLEDWTAAQTALESRSRQVSTLVDIGRAVPNERSLREALQRLLRAVVELTGFRSAGCFLLRPSGMELDLRAQAAVQPTAIPEPQRLLMDAPPDLEALVRGRV
ncbi:MAG: hypothetical protein ACREJB_17795, partial [Planctomycetaceae bacterium]